MGNGVGKIIGVVAGAACMAIPGVGQVAGVLILAGTITAGSAVDAVIDNKNQNEVADSAAEEARRNAAIEVERQRVTAQRRLEEEARIAHENRAANELQIEENRSQQLRDRERQEASVREAQAQIDLVVQSLAGYERGDFIHLPALLLEMDEAHFELFSQQALLRCQTPDAMEEGRVLLEQEQLRRELVQGWTDQLNNTVANNVLSMRR